MRNCGRDFETMTDLTRRVLEEQHTAAEYFPWVRSLILELKNEPEGLEKIRLRVGLAKELMNEAYPIGLLASRFFGSSDQVHIALKIGNQPFDATVSDLRPDCTSIQYVEVTVAGEGENDYLRMRTLQESGQVSGLGRVTKTGTKQSGLHISVENSMVSQAEVLERERNSITAAIERKIPKSYPADTLLLIAFDDTMAFDRPDNISNIEAIVTAFLPQLKRFHSVALVGTQKGMFLSWRSENAT